MRTPGVILADWIRGSDDMEEVQRFNVSGESRWVLARPVSCGPWWERFRLAFDVFRGRYDALAWMQDSPSLDYLPIREEMR